MKIKSKTIAALGLVSALAVGGYAAAAYAHGGKDRDGRGFGGKHAWRAVHMMERYDTNADGALTQDEVLAARTAQFNKFDANGDGALELGEYKNLWMEAMYERMVDRFQKHDSDGDGKISADDFNKRFARMIQWMDRNGDGKADADDMRWRHKDRD